MSNFGTMNISQIHAIFLSCNGVSTDTRNLPKGCLYVALKGDRFDGNTFAEAALKNGAAYALVDDPKLQGDQYLQVSDSLKALQALAAFHRLTVPTKIIAITGSNGKTTTKELMFRVLSQEYNALCTVGNLNNHIGVPLTLLRLTPQTQVAVIEMGANHLGEIAFLTQLIQPDLGYITNFGKAHLEGFGSLEGVINGKSELYDYLRKNDLPVLINGNDSTQKERTNDMSAFSIGEGINHNISIKFEKATPHIAVTLKGVTIQSQLIGDYNKSNIAAAIGLGMYLGMNITQIQKGIESYSPQNNRSQEIKKNGRSIVLDAYNANPTSMRAALHSFAASEAPKIALLGDMFELGKVAQKEHQDLVNEGENLNIEYLYWIGNKFNKVQLPSPKHRCFESVDLFIDHIKDNPLADGSVLIKGSRGMQMESILEFL